MKNKVYQEFKVEIVNKVEKLLIKYFGTTGNPNKAGYILTNGQMLDFSMGQRDRVQDHREVNYVLNENEIDLGKYDTEEQWKYSNSTGMLALLDMGIIRFGPESYSFDMA